MHDSIIRTKTRTYSTPRASLVAMGALIQEQQILDPIHRRVRIPQKTRQYTPTEKLDDALIAILAGAHGMVDVNTRLRSDLALQRAFGRRGCAEQSTIQDTLNHSTAETVAQLEQALHEILVQHSAAVWHDYAARFQILDVDLSGMPCGPKAPFATKGYFDGQYHRRGRQLGRVVASHYDEVIVDRIYAGTTHLGPILTTLMSHAETILGLDQAEETMRRARTLVRIDAGGGGVAGINWLLARGYGVLSKDYSSQRAAKLATSVVRWVEDPRCAGRQVGWVQARATEYTRPVLRIAVRCPTQRGRWRTAVLVTSLWPEQALAEVTLTPEEWRQPDAELLALVYLYDARGGGAETTFHGDKQGLGLTKRTKRHWQGQQVVTLLGMLAHNLIVWCRRWLAAVEPMLRHYGIMRMVRDVYQLHGRVSVNGWGQVVRIALVATIPLAQRVGTACRKLFAMHSIVISLGKT